MANNYSYEPPILPSIHRCRWCNKKLSEVPKQDIVCEAVFMSNDGVVHWYCNKECAKAQYDSYEHELDILDELNKYIKGEK